MDYKFEKTKTGKLKVKEEFTPARRWSFLVGTNEKSHTAQSRLVNILVNDEQAPTLEEIEKAFDIETVTREFFLKYRELFMRTKEELDQVVKNDPKIKADFEAKGVDTVNFAKKLLGQIVFLYFLQKKGWFGVGRDDVWGAGSKHFLRQMFEKKHGEYNNFFNDILEPLFYEALRIDRGHDDHYYSRFNCKIPFLNGGLFDPIGNYDWVHTDIIIPDRLFSNTNKTKEGDIGDGILDIFDRYNFTVKEDEPLDKEVAIDPELLGKAYEKFNAIRPDNFDEFRDALKSGKTGEENKFNKKFGVYYTPREIVHYMCQQSLINYLANELEGKASKEDIEILIHTGEHVSENEARIIQEGRETQTYSHKLPESVRKHALLIDQKLAEITVCDPAVGSGAFPVGMMGEIVKTRNVLSTFIQDNTRTPYEFKRRCIEHSLYGVDIDPGAVEIAKLRLWLSLVVDEDEIKNIKPLPNLDYKVVCGNSLLGVEKNLFNKQLFKELEKLKPIFFNETNPGKKQEHKKQIDELINQITSGHIEFDFEVYFSEIFHQKGGFDVVIANPPYVRVQNLAHEIIDVYKKRWLTAWKRIDISTLFIELGYSILNKNGQLCFISSNQFLTTEYGRKLRKYLLEKAALEMVVDFGDLGVFDALTYASIFLLSKYNNEYFLYHKVNDLPFSVPNKFHKIQISGLTEDIWSLGENKEISIIKKLKSLTDRLERYAKCWAGVFTGKDDLLLYKIDEDVNAIEKELLMPVIRAQDCERYGYATPSKKIFYPYEEVGNKTTLIDLKKLKEKYPKTYSFILINEKILKSRKDSRRTIGEKKGWYGLIRFGCIERFRKPKIVSPGEVKGNKFSLDLTGSAFSCGRVFSITSENEKVDIKFLLAILNSKLIEFYLHKNASLKQGGYYSYSSTVLNSIPLPLILQNERQKPFIEYVDKILTINKNEDYMQTIDKQTKVKAIEAKIDQMVYELYGLTQEEIAIVEGALKK
jgi:methylase of polypeptide subunit release factors